MNEIFNGKLHEVVKQLYEELIAEFGNQDSHSEEFLSSFPYRFIEDEGERHRRIVDAALSPAFHQEAHIDACYSNSAGGDLEFYLCRAVEDFLNYIIPRTIALSDGAELFERYYRHFDSSIYGKSCLVTVVAIIRDIWDHSGGGSILPPGFRLSWLVNGPKLTVPYTRGRAVPFFEIRKSARPIGRGRNLTEESGFYVLEYSASLPKKRDILGAAYHLKQDVITKFLLAARIKTFATAHSDYRGFRMLGHLSAYSMNLVHYPDDVIEDGEGRSLQEVDGMAIDRLLTKILPQPFSKFAVINQKIEDAMRRRRTAIRNDERAQKMNQIDQLLDYFQVLEAIVPAEGSEYISLYAARVLTPPIVHRTEDLSYSSSSRTCTKFEIT